MTLRIHDEIPETHADDIPDMLDNLIMEQELLADALEKLTREERDLIILHYYSEYTLLQITKLMRRPYGQIKRLHMKALQKLNKPYYHYLDKLNKLAGKKRSRSPR